MSYMKEPPPKASKYDRASYIVLINRSNSLGKTAHIPSDEAGQEGHTLCGKEIFGNRDRYGEPICKRCEQRATMLEKTT